ncbi:MAG: cohesin domain-containing protein [Desulfotomaculaceae bacterium]|nr:cohesin domain-containing protein [Desulfotomaculaceae bacterium]
MGETFELEVTMSPASLIQATEFKVKYDPNYLSAVPVSSGDKGLYFQPGSPFADIESVKNEVLSNADGSKDIWFVGAWLGATTYTSTTNNVIGKIKFQVVKEGSTDVAFSFNQLVDNQVLEVPSQGSPAHLTLVAGDGPGISILSTEEVVAPGLEFKVKVFIENVEDLYAASFDIKYDPERLTAVKVEEGAFAVGTPLVNMIDPVEGLVSYGQTKIGAVSGVSGEGVFAWVTFKANTAEAITQLNFQPTGDMFFDSTGAPMENVAMSGASVYVQNKGAIYGTVTMKNINEKNNIGIDITVTPTDPVRETETGPGGYYQVSGLADNSYKVVATRLGYLMRESDYYPSAVGAPVNVNLELLFGDVDNNDVINMADIVALAIVYNNLPSGKEYYDYNYNNKVDMQDLVNIALNYNKKYVPK